MSQPDREFVDGDFLYMSRHPAYWQSRLEALREAGGFLKIAAGTTRGIQIANILVSMADEIASMLADYKGGA